MEGQSLIDVAKLHRLLGENRPLSVFYKCVGCKQATETLQQRGLAQSSIMVKAKPHRGSIATCRAHPLIAFEFLRWSSYDKFALQALRMLDRDEQQQQRAA